jgi:hypothetical protein
MSMYSEDMVSNGPRRKNKGPVTSFRVRPNGEVEPLDSYNRAPTASYNNLIARDASIKRNESGKPRDFDIYKQPQTSRVSYPYNDPNTVSLNQVELTPRGTSRTGRQSIRRTPGQTRGQYNEGDYPQYEQGIFRIQIRSNNLYVLTSIQSFYKKSRY